MKLGEPYELRGSRTVLWERRGAIPLRDPISSKYSAEENIICNDRKNHYFWYYENIDSKYTRQYRFNQS